MWFAYNYSCNALNLQYINIHSAIIKYLLTHSLTHQNIPNLWNEEQLHVINGNDKQTS